MPRYQSRRSFRAIPVEAMQYARHSDRRGVIAWVNASPKENRKSKAAFANAKGELIVPTSAGQHFQVPLGDYVVDMGDGFTCIPKDQFEHTYVRAAEPVQEI